MKRGSLQEIIKDGRFTHCLICGKRLEGKSRSDRNVCNTSCRVHKHTGFKAYDKMFDVLIQAKGYPPQKAYEKLVEIDIKNEQPIRVLELWWKNKNK